MSPDFRRHSVAYFFEPLLAHHDKSRFDIHCYANFPSEDEVTFRLQSLAGHWRNIYGMKDKDVADIVRRDGIDILVDLSGHTGGNRLRVFALKPAPVQVTYLGYPDTTGLKTIDYRFTDAEADPPGLTERYHSEKLVRLPSGFLCYRPPDRAPEVQPLPAAARNGHVTFACFNNFPKLSPQILRVWARILASLPTARLLVKSLALADAESQQYARDYFIGHGLPIERIVMLPRDGSSYDHLRRYGEADIALDVYPYAGTTTTFEALFMGLPVVSLRGRAHVSRVGGSILTRVGAADWVCDDEEAYVARALDLAGDVGRLGELRRSLRQRLLASPLCDGAAFARQVEEAYLRMWEQAGA
jgi:predicted O-linked N-acetylglucosamine transferase (SPINDLY family)